MAKSYVTKFTEYVEEQRDRLAEKLEGKGISSTHDLSLGALVAQLDNLRDDYTTAKYDRDPNLPDIDEMFNNDPLRAVNGGQYKACYYMLMPVDMNGVVGLYYNKNAILYSAEKIIFSDGTEYSQQTANLLHNIDSSGVYTDTQGQKFALVKFYATEPIVNTTYNTLYPAIEMINDYYIGFAPQIITSISGYLIPYNGYQTRYFRYVGSNNTVSNIFENSSTYWNLGYLYYAKTIIVEGVHRFYTTGAPFYNVNKMIFSGELYGSSNTSSSISMTIGSTGNIPYGTHLDYLELPYSSLPMSMTLGLIGLRKLVIPDTTYTYFGIYSPNQITDLHIGANINYTITNQATDYTSLRNVTVSSGAFGLNTSAITINFGVAYNLTKESLMNMFNNFADRTGMEANILRLSAISKLLVTDEEKAILTNKNWTIS